MGGVKNGLDGRFKGDVRDGYAFLRSKKHVIGSSRLASCVLQEAFGNAHARGLELGQHAVNLDVTFLVAVALVAKDRLLHDVAGYAGNLVAL